MPGCQPDSSSLDVFVIRLVSWDYAMQIHKVFCLPLTAGTQPDVHCLSISSNTLHFGLGTTDNQPKPATGGADSVY